MDSGESNKIAGLHESLDETLSAANQHLDEILHSDIGDDVSHGGTSTAGGAGRRRED